MKKCLPFHHMTFYESNRFDCFFMGEIMTEKMKFLLVPFLLFAVVLGVTSYTYSAINEKIYGTIKVAYMNGFIDAVGFDSGKVEMMKADRKFLQQEVLAAAARYEETVRRMNTSQGEAGGER